MQTTKIDNEIQALITQAVKNILGRVGSAEAISVLAARLAAGRIVFVGDRLEDVSAARQAGVKVVGMRNAAYPWETDEADAVATEPAGMLIAIRALLTQAKE